MKKNNHLSLTFVLFAASLTAAVAGPKQFQRKQLQADRFASAQQQMLSPVVMLPQDVATASSSTLQPDGTISGSWGAITSAVGETWFYTQQINTGYTQSLITVYDGMCEEQTHFTVKPELPEGYTLNVIQPYGTITSRFFDTDASTWEIMVMVHGYNANLDQYYEIQAYNNLGELVYQTQASNALFLDASQGFTSYQRVILITSEVNAETHKEQDCFSVLHPATSTAGPTIEHTFSVDSELFYYGEGPTFSTFLLDGKPYYVIAHFGKLYATLPDANEDGEVSDDDIVVTPDNTFEVEVYDGSYNEAGHLSIPVNVPEGALYRFPAFGMFSYSDLSKGYFTGDDQFNFIVTQYDYYTELDDELASFEVYDASGQLLKVLTDRCVTWGQLADVSGQDDQFKFVRQYADGTQELTMIDLPSGRVVTTFGEVAGGMQTSSYIDRYAVGDTYQYAMGINQGTYDNTGCVVGYIGWFKSDGEVDHFDSFPLAKGIASFTPWISGQTLNPFLINTDEQHEYIILVKQENSAGGYDDVLYITNASGATIATFGADDELGVVNQVGLLEGSHPALLIGYWGWDAVRRTSHYTLARYALPFESFADDTDQDKDAGTQDHPYVISTAGDLALIKDKPAADYILAADIDMRQYYGQWTPIANFTGTLDGQGHSIDHLTVNVSEAGTYFAGLFGRMGDMLASTTTTVRNLVMRDAVVNVTTSSCVSAGIVAADAMGVNFENVQIYDSQIHIADGIDTRCGGIAGQGSNGGSFTGCYVDGFVVEAPDATEIGGICGSLKTATHVNACAVNATINAKGTIGGISGVVGNSAAVEINDCHTNVSITSQGTQGGIVGNAVGVTVRRCFAEQGSIVSYVDEIAGAVVNNCLTTSSPVYQYSVWESDPNSDTNESITSNYAAADIELSPSWLTETLGFQFGNAVTTPWAWDEASSLPLLWFELADDASGITAVAADAPATPASPLMYNLMGQRVQQAQQSGFVISNNSLRVNY